MQHVSRVFRTLADAQLKAKLAKCVFGVRTVEFLGHVISQGRISMDPSKRQAIVSWGTPLTSPKQVRQFMGLVSYYRNFVPHLATLAEPLTRLTRKRVRMEWGWEAENAMEGLKKAIMRAEELTTWSETLPTRVTTDASEVGMGAILEQMHGEGQWKIVASWSRKLTTCQCRYSTTDREWLAVVECITRVWKHWLLGREFELRTDHAALKEILKRKGEDFTHRQLRWYERLEPYAFTVAYVKGKDNVVPDALSRTPSFYAVNAIELCPKEAKMICAEDLRAAIQEDRKYQEVLDDEGLQKQLGVVKQDDMLVTETGQVCVPCDRVLRFKLALEAHEPMFAGHFSSEKTLAQLRRHWWWPHMTSTVEKVVVQCPMCQCDAVKKRRDEGPIHPIPASAPWEVVTIDFISGFAPSMRNRHTACCVVCDRFTRMIHLESCRDHATARETVGMVMRMIIARHGCPRIIISDRGTQFDSELWAEVWRMLGTKVAMASTHHPQTNGLTERCNRTLLSLIRKYAHMYPQRWAEFLPLFEFAYNSAVHSITRVSPFRAEKGYDPLIPATLLTTELQLGDQSDQAMNEHVNALKRAIKQIHTIVKHNETCARIQTTHRENMRRGKPIYHVGDEVLVYWPPFRPYADVARKHRLRYIGPFRVTNVPNANVVELLGLPERMPRTINTEYIHLYNRDTDSITASMRASANPPLPTPSGG